MAERLASRASALGEVGANLTKHLGVNDHIIARLDAGDQVYLLSRLVVAGQSERAAAASLLLCEFPSQIEVSQRFLEELVPIQQFESEKKKNNGDFEYIGEDGKDTLPLKNHLGAKNKVNVYFSEILNSLRKVSPRLVEELDDRKYFLQGLYNDSASAMLMHAYGCLGILDDPLGFSAVCTHKQDVAKAISTVVKALGMNSTQYGSVMCECAGLSGRMTGETSEEKEVDYRVDPDEVRKSVVNCDAKKLKAAIRRILQHELGNVSFEDRESFWTRRWFWCVNGAHSKLIEREEPQWFTGMQGTLHRKVFSENTRKNPLGAWSGKSYFTMSQKLEHGKTRAIFGGDSITYFCFEHLLRPVEKAWKGRKVLLDPGKGGTRSMIERIRKYRSKAGVCTMLDYDDFNSQHSLDACKMVFEELTAHTGYDAELSRKLIDSFDRQYVSTRNGLKKLMGTLMSGHRATTFINSVLNLAYILVADENVFKMRSLHVGDDVILFADNAVKATETLCAVRDAGLRMNALKQSFGVYTAEFLRVAMTEKIARGYLARSVASVVSGNWVSERALDLEQALTTMASACWTLRNRSGKCFGKILAKSISRMSEMSVKDATALGEGRLSFNRSPVRASNKSVRVFKVTDQSDAPMAKAISRIDGDTFATEEYLSNHATPVEIVAVRRSGNDIKDMMIGSSYQKTLLSRGIVDEQELALYDAGIVYRPVDAGNIDTPSPLTAKTGVLGKYPLINMVKKNLNEHDVEVLLKMLGEFEPGVDVLHHAFGDNSDDMLGVSFCSEGLTYEEAMRYPKGGEHVLYCTYPIYM